MTIAQFRRWLEAKIQWAEGSDEFNESENVEARCLIDEAHGYAIDLRLPAAAEAARKGPVRQRLVEILNAIAEPADSMLSIAGDTHATPGEVATLLKKSPDAVLEWIRKGELKASNLNKRGKRPRWSISRADLSEFLKKRQPAPPQKKTRRKPEADVIEYF